MKGGWGRGGGALFRKLSSVQFWQRRPRWTLGDGPLLPFLSVGVSPKGCSLPTCFHLDTQPSKQTGHTSNTPENQRGGGDARAGSKCHANHGGAGSRSATLPCFLPCFPRASKKNNNMKIAF